MNEFNGRANIDTNLKLNQSDKAWELQPKRAYQLRFVKDINDQQSRARRNPKSFIIESRKTRFSLDSVATLSDFVWCSRSDERGLFNVSSFVHPFWWNKQRFCFMSCLTHVLLKPNRFSCERRTKTWLKQKKIEEVFSRIETWRPPDENLDFWLSRNCFELQTKTVFISKFASFSCLCQWNGNSQCSLASATSLFLDVK